MLSLLASIPSPGSASIHIGSVQLRAYGLCIALGVMAAVWLASKRWVARGGSPDDFPAIALWAVPAGVIGARLYHVITDWHRFSDHPLDAVKIWEGGLGIWGGVALGAAVGAWVARRRGLDILDAMDAAAPGIVLAQAIGRLGNWFNQELFGGPTDLPWGLEIDPAHRPEEHLAQPTFHPTFLYEIVWNLAILALLLWVDSHHRLRRGKLFVLYVAGYTFGRFFIERVRIDEATHLWGLRINEIVSAVVFLVAVGLLFVGPLRAPEPLTLVSDLDGPDDDGTDEEGSGDEPLDGAAPDDDAEPGAEVGPDEVDVEDDEDDDRDEARPDDVEPTVGEHPPDGAPDGSDDAPDGTGDPDAELEADPGGGDDDPDEPATDPTDPVRERTDHG